MKQLSPREERIVMRAFDGEANWFQRRHAEKLFKKNPAATELLQLLENSREVMQVPENDPPVDLWEGVMFKIAQEERSGARRMVPLFESSTSPLYLWMSRLGWSASGAFVTATLLLLFVQPRSDFSNTASIASSAGGRSNASGIPSVQLSATGLRPAMKRGMEVDWLKSEGTLRLIQEPQQNSTIIWVKRKPTRRVAKVPTE